MAQEIGERSPETGPAEFGALRDEVAMLRDLFQRRLFEDRARQQMYDELCSQLSFARSELAEQFVTPLFRELLLLVDRVEALLIAAEMVNPTEALTTIHEELVEVLARHGVHAIEVENRVRPHGPRGRRPAGDDAGARR